MFYFVVRHLHWFARVPGFPQLFDALLLTGTCLARRQRLAAMETLESEALRLPGVRLRPHRFGGIEFVQDGGHELGHLHGHGLLDVPVGNQAAIGLIAAGRVRAHHVFPRSKWVSFQIESIADVPFALELLSMAGASEEPRITRISTDKEEFTRESR
jgi:Family of unknown function (DUF5519)